MAHYEKASFLEGQTFNSMLDRIRTDVVDPPPEQGSPMALTNSPFASPTHERIPGQLAIMGSPSGSHQSSADGSPAQEPAQERTVHDALRVFNRINDASDVEEIVRSPDTFGLEAKPERSFGRSLSFSVGLQMCNGISNGRGDVAAAKSSHEHPSSKVKLVKHATGRNQSKPTDALPTPPSKPTDVGTAIAKRCGNTALAEAKALAQAYAAQPTAAGVGAQSRKATNNGAPGGSKTKKKADISAKKADAVIKAAKKADAVIQKAAKKADALIKKADAARQKGEAAANKVEETRQKKAAQKEAEAAAKKVAETRKRTEKQRTTTQGQSAKTEPAKKLLPGVTVPPPAKRRLLAKTSEDQAVDTPALTLAIPAWLHFDFDDIVTKAIHAATLPCITDEDRS